MLGVARSGGLHNSVTGSLEGDVFHFNVGGMDYVGKVEGDRINPLQGEGVASGWSARRS